MASVSVKLNRACLIYSLRVCICSIDTPRPHGRGKFRDELLVQMLLKSAVSFGGEIFNITFNFLCEPCLQAFHLRRLRSRQRSVPGSAVSASSYWRAAATTCSNESDSTSVRTTSCLRSRISRFSRCVDLRLFALEDLTISSRGPHDLVSRTSRFSLGDLTIYSQR